MPRTSHAPQRAGQFAPADWRLLIRLPAEVMIAAIGPRDDGPRRTVAEGLAGLDAIAAGRDSDSELVRAVVAAIYSEQQDDADELAPTADPSGHPAQVLDRCRRASELLRANAGQDDAAAYRRWVQQVAVHVCEVSRSRDVPGTGGERTSAPEREFLHDLASAMS